MSSNWRNWFLGSGESRELRDTLDLYRKAKDAQRRGPLASEKALDSFVVDLIFEACERRGVTPAVPLGRALSRAIRELLVLEGVILDLPEEQAISSLTVEEAVLARATWGRHLRFVSDSDRLLAVWREKLVWVFSGILGYLPLSAFTDVNDRGVAVDDSVVLPEARMLDLCDKLPEVVERTMMTFFDDDVVNARLFDSVRERFDRNCLRASGISHEKRHEAAGKIVLPTRNNRASSDGILDAYLQGTPFHSFFLSPLPFAIPFPARFEHTHIVGGTGHGKTQLIQFLINHDLVRSADDGRSVVVIDSQGDLIRTISQLEYFSPLCPKGLSDRLVLVDPNDVEHPACLNMFDFNRDRLSGYPPLDREKILNATVELYEYFFGALLGAELTQRQGVIFKYLARLLIEIPDATIHTLRELMEGGERFRPYMEKLTGTPRNFFATRFFDRQFNETKKQILTRLWGVLSNASLERMFSHSRNKVDIFELLNSGRIILINTAKELLGQEGAAIFGRFFIALIAQAAVQRAALPPHERRPSFVYIDEAQDYFDENISNLLHQARKYRVGLIFAHQNLDQLGTGLRSSVLASTSIKFAGGVSAKDAAVMDSELRCNAEFLMAQRKGPRHSEFACHVRNYTGHALSVHVPLGYMEALPVLGTAERESLLERNRGLYSAPPEVPADMEIPAEISGWSVRQRPQVFSGAGESAGRQSDRSRPVSGTVEPEIKQGERVPPVPGSAVQPGRGGQQHKYVQHLLKQLAEDRGFRATIEESILDGAGSVDVALARGDRRIAAEISVTTGRDQELGNIEKCLAAGYGEVLLIGINERQVKSLAKFVEENLEESARGKVRYLTPENLTEYLDSLGEPTQSSEKTVRGYRVRTTQQILDPKEADSRRRAIAEVIARSLSRQRRPQA